MGVVPTRGTGSSRITVTIAYSAASIPPTFRSCVDDQYSLWTGAFTVSFSGGNGLRTGTLTYYKTLAMFRR
jgi:hypothetical protein